MATAGAGGSGAGGNGTSPGAPAPPAKGGGTVAVAPSDGPGPGADTAAAPAAPDATAAQGSKKTPAKEVAAGKDDDDDDDDDEDDDEFGEGQKKKKDNIWSRILPRSARKEAEEASADDRRRLWELIFVMKGCESVCKNRLNVFFTIHLQFREDKTHKHPRAVAGILPRCTRVFDFKPDQEIDLPRPETVLHKKFRMSYREATQSVVRVDMWSVRHFSFNEYFGFYARSMAEIGTKAPDMGMILKKKLSKRQLKAKQHAFDVAKLTCAISLEEFFDFQLDCDHWNLRMQQAKLGAKDDFAERNFETLMSQRKKLKFIMPQNRFADPSRAGSTPFGAKAARSTVQLTNWSTDPLPTNAKHVASWPNTLSFKFRGTRSGLRNAFFILVVYTEHTHLIVENNPLAMKLVGKAVVPLSGVGDRSVFRGFLKQITYDEDKPYVIGELEGNVNLTQRTMGVKATEDEILGPTAQFKKLALGQPASAANVMQLSKYSDYLVVHLTKCEHLPVANQEKYSSDPYVSIEWDNMINKTVQLKNQLRPVYNHFAYFPVRFVDVDKVKRGTHKKALLERELASKGDIILEVWDDDTTSAEFLGTYRLALNSIVSSKNVVSRTMAGEVKKSTDKGAQVGVLPDEGEDGGDDNPFDAPLKQEWYEKQVDTPVFDCKQKGMPLVSQQESTAVMGQSGAPTIFFEAYFYKRMDTTSVGEAHRTSDEERQLWSHKQLQFERLNMEFRAMYADKFPDSIGAKETKEAEGGGVQDPPLQYRRFLCVASQISATSADVVPLMTKIIRVPIPEALSHPAELLHWASCLSFNSTRKQLHNGLIPQDSWSNPEFILNKRRGPVQDHATILCSMLLGAGRDAYVCKGTVRVKKPSKKEGPSKSEAERFDTVLLEHTWVMTRLDGWVTFWEPCNHQMYHLPNRYKEKKKNKHNAQQSGKGKKKAGKADEQQDAGSGLAAVEDDADDPLAGMLPGEAEDAFVTQEDMLDLPTVGRKPKAKSKVSGKRHEPPSGRLMSVESLLQLPIAPQREMLKEKNLVNWLPYDSIEVVFNDKNLWANHQNHHPACISYDLYGDDEEGAKDMAHKAWLPYMGRFQDSDDDDDHRKLAALTAGKQITLMDQMKAGVVEQFETQIKEELETNIYLYRTKKGLDFHSDSSPNIQKCLVAFLDLQETLLRLDTDIRTHEFRNQDVAKYFEEKLAYKLLKHNRLGSPFKDNASFSKYKTHQDLEWAKLEEKIQNLLDCREKFPTKPGKQFKGFAIHFSMTEVERIRDALMDVEEYQRFLNAADDNVFYSLECCIFPLQGLIQSVWLYIGIQEAITEESKAVAASGGTPDL